METSNFLFQAGTYPHWVIVLLIIALLVDLTVRGIALWKSARKAQTFWFVALLVVNSMAILPVIYLLTEKNKKEKEF